MIVALTGGVGGAKLAHGLARVLPPAKLKLVVNTGDDFEHLGLHISPDLDTLVYTLAGIANPQAGWGRADETWEFMGALRRLGGPDWFQLGDRDLALHVLRTGRLRRGESLSGFTASLCSSLGVRCAVAPMSDDPVRTMLRTVGGVLGFQEYFVRERCAPRVLGVAYAGAAEAAAQPGVLAWLSDPALEQIVLCPSNPFLSIDPILAVPELGAALRAARAPKIAVSPIVAGAALKGPAAKLMAELGAEASALGIARHYRGLIDCLFVDEADAPLVPAIEALGMRAVAAPIVMRSDEDRRRLAARVLEYGRVSACTS